VQAGDAIPVRYLARDPGVNALAGPHPDEFPLGLFLIIPLFATVFATTLSRMFLPRLREILAARRLYRTGVLTEGKVVFVKRRTAAGWPGAQMQVVADFRVYVTCRLPTGQSVELIAPCTNEWLLNHLAPGTVVHVLHDAGDTTKCALLEAFIR
jgi:hypothetical protein